MRVLQLLKTSHGATWAYLQMRELVKLGVEVHAALPAGGPLIPRYQQAGINVHLVQLDLPVKAPWRIPKVTKTLAELVATVKPDLIHSHFVGTTLSMRLALGRKHPTPRIFQVPGPLHLEHSFFRQLDLRSAGAPDYWVGSVNGPASAISPAVLIDSGCFSHTMEILIAKQRRPKRRASSEANLR